MTSERTPSKKIRQIQYGLIPTQPSLVIRIGNRVRINQNEEYTVSAIIENKNTFFDFGSFEYEIYVSSEEEPQADIFWKRLLRLPDTIEYFINNDDEYIL
jgi:hypothetical protein